MTSPVTLNNLQTLLEFPFKQPDGVRKLVVGAALTLLSFVVPIVPGLFVAGYHAAIARRAIHTGALVLPEWDDWSTLLLDGVKVFGVTLIGLLPALLTFFLGYGGMVGTSLGAAIIEDAGPRAITGLVPLLMLGSLGGIALLGVGLILALAAGFILPAALMHMLATGRFSSAFAVREWGALLRANLSGFLLGFVILLGLSFVFSFAVQILQLTIVLCCLVPFVLGAYSMYIGTVSSGLFGLIYRDAVEKQRQAPAPVPPAPPAPALG